MLLEAADLTRVDRKYLVPRDVAAAFLDRLDPSFRVLTVDGRRTTSDSSVYVDTERLDACRDHVQQRRRRWTVRTRMYVEDQLCRVEVKTRDGRGVTEKSMTTIHVDRHGLLDGDEATFVRRALAQRRLDVDGPARPLDARGLRAADPGRHRRRPPRDPRPRRRAHGGQPPGVGGRGLGPHRDRGRPAAPRSRPAAPVGPVDGASWSSGRSRRWPCSAARWSRGPTRPSSTPRPRTGSRPTPPPRLFSDAAVAAIGARIVEQRARADRLMQGWFAQHGSSRDDAAFEAWRERVVPPPSAAERTEEVARVQAIAPTRTAAGVSAASWLEAHGKKDVWKLAAHDQAELLPATTGEALKSDVDDSLKMAKDVTDALGAKYQQSAPYVLHPSLRPDHTVSPGDVCPCSYPRGTPRPGRRPRPTWRNGRRTGRATTGGRWTRSPGRASTWPATPRATSRPARCSAT